MKNESLNSFNMTELYHYTMGKYVPSILETGIYDNHPYFTTTQYYNAFHAGQELGVMPHNINCVLKFKNDGLFKRYYQDVPNTKRFYGGGNQYLHLKRPKPIAMRQIEEQEWKILI
jgi:hypothetical protein